MRKLKTVDVFAFCRCLKNIGIKDEIERISKDAKTAKDAWAKGFDLLYNIFDLATENKGEEEIYTFLAGPFEMSAEEVAGLELAEFAKLCEKLAKENDLQGFFHSVQGLMK